MKKARFAYDAVIFDIDNVLIDTRRSYLDAIRWTVEIFLTEGRIPFFVYSRKVSQPQILKPQDISQFKLLGGFNDDWDCCYGLLVYLLNLSVKGRSVADLLRAKNIKGFCAQIQKRPLLVSGIVEKLGRPASVTIEKISRIFQEVYLGKDLFERIELKKACFWPKRGLIHKEKLIFRKSTLVNLKERGIELGIATGRSRFEAAYALKRFGVLELFNSITSIGEVRRAEQEMKQSLRKPHPYSLIQTAKKIGAKKRFLYIGDLPDDILAAQRAKKEIAMDSIAFPWFAEEKSSTLEAIEQVGPDFLIKKPGELLKLVEHPEPFRFKSERLA